MFTRPRVVAAIAACVLAALQPGGPAQADVARKHFAVLEFSGSKDITEDDRMMLSDAARTGVRGALPMDRYVVVTRESMLKVLREMGKKDCQEGECEVDTLQNIGADYGLTAHVAKVEGVYLVTMKVFDAASGNLMASGSIQAAKKLELLGLTTEKSASLVRTGLRLGATSEEPAAPVAVDAPEVKQGGPKIKKGKATAALGELRVDVKPKEGARLELEDPNGKKLSSGAPYSNAQALVGTWKLVVRAEGFEDDVRDVEVPPDELTAVKVVMKALGGLKVTGKPAGASVKVSGPGGFSDEGGFPWEASGLKSGTYTVTVSRKGYETSEKSVVVEPGQDAEVVVELGKAGEGSAGMVKIPGGTFFMGSNDGDADEKPVHKVTLSPYFMDKTEVTVAQYAACVRAGACTPASSTVDRKDIKEADRTLWSQFCNANKSDKQSHPVNCVDWNQAKAYCAYRGGRLPTEAEWEYAARGSDGRKFPWGNGEPGPTLLNAGGGEFPALGKRLGQNWGAMYAGSDGWDSTAPVGSYPSGASPFGLLDMAGNVWEWNSDLYGAYGTGEESNPTGATTGTARLLRGGSWSSTTQRRRFAPPIGTGMSRRSGTAVSDSVARAGRFDSAFPPLPNATRGKDAGMRRALVLEERA